MPITVSPVDLFFNTIIKNYNKQPGQHSVARSFEIGAHKIKIRFSSSSLEEFFIPAIRHLETGRDTFDDGLEIIVTERKTSGIELPDPFWSSEEIDPLSGNILHLQDEYYANYNNITATFTFIDRGSKKAIFWADDINKIPEWEKGFPFRTLLFNWFYKKGYLFIHAGGVSTKKAGILLTGKGGSGKSTAALACLRSNLLYAGDDYIMIDPEKCIGYSLYNIGKIEAHNIFRFPELRKHLVNETEFDTEKRRLFVHDFLPGKIIKQFPIKAILLPKYTGLAETVIKEASKADAMKAMAPSSVWLLRTDLEMVNKIASLIRKLPCYWLETGTDIDKIPMQIEKLITELDQ